MASSSPVIADGWDDDEWSSFDEAFEASHGGTSGGDGADGSGTSPAPTTATNPVTASAIAGGGAKSTASASSAPIAAGVTAAVVEDASRVTTEPPPPPPLTTEDVANNPTTSTSVASASVTEKSTSRESAAPQPSPPPPPSVHPQLESYILDHLRQYSLEMATDSQRIRDAVNGEFRQKFSSGDPDADDVKAVADLTEYYLSRPQLRKYTFERELPRMTYRVKTHGRTLRSGKTSGVVILDTCDDIRRHFNFDPNKSDDDDKEEEKSQRPDVEDVLWRASNQSLLADALCTLTSPEHNVVRPQFFTTAIAEDCSFFVNLVDKFVSCECFLRVSIPAGDHADALGGPHHGMDGRVDVGTVQLSAFYSPSIPGNTHTPMLEFHVSDLQPAAGLRDDPEGHFRALQLASVSLARDWMDTGYTEPGMEGLGLNLPPPMSHHLPQGQEDTWTNNQSLLMQGGSSLRDALLFNPTAMAASNFARAAAVGGREGLVGALRQLDDATNMKSKLNFLKEVKLLPTAEELGGEQEEEQLNFGNSPRDGPPHLHGSEGFPRRARTVPPIAGGDAASTAFPGGSFPRPPPPPSDAHRSVSATEAAFPGGTFPRPNADNDAAASEAFPGGSFPRPLPPQRGGSSSMGVSHTASAGGSAAAADAFPGGSFPRPRADVLPQRNGAASDAFPGGAFPRPPPGGAGAPSNSASEAFPGGAFPRPPPPPQHTDAAAAASASAAGEAFPGGAFPRPHGEAVPHRPPPPPPPPPPQRGDGGGGGGGGGSRPPPLIGGLLFSGLSRMAQAVASPDEEDDVGFQAQSRPRPPEEHISLYRKEEKDVRGREDERRPGEGLTLYRREEEERPPQQQSQPPRLELYRREEEGGKGSGVGVPVAKSGAVRPLRVTNDDDDDLVGGADEGDGWSDDDIEIEEEEDEIDDDGNQGQVEFYSTQSSDKVTSERRREQPSKPHPPPPPPLADRSGRTSTSCGLTAKTTVGTGLSAEKVEEEEEEDWVKASAGSYEDDDDDIVETRKRWRRPVMETGGRRLWFAAS